MRSTGLPETLSQYSDPTAAPPRAEAWTGTGIGPLPDRGLGAQLRRRD